ncbi:hypothetical protein P4479_12255 [Brevibacillus agri]|uniref:hypothetical protein n=1 Tax=Brevibacillus agri TaxID=51101 RepID=UPI0002A4CF5C|nr:hypothetical protein [Brevibacillus agri]ELK41338.1 hypothetical protein D478_14605 [Brevibacillus agri BAB-2500]MED3499213.1 hypothetical protein [Brevibacillus agri]
MKQAVHFVLQLYPCGLGALGRNQPLPNVVRAGNRMVRDGISCLIPFVFDFVHDVGKNRLRVNQLIGGKVVALLCVFPDDEPTEKERDHYRQLPV